MGRHKAKRPKINKKYFNNLGMKFTDSVTKGDLTELKSLAKPPVHVVETLGAFVYLIYGGEKIPKEWAVIKRYLGDSNLLNDMIRFDVNDIPRSRAIAVERKLARLDFQSVQSSSAAATGIFLWIIQILKTYSESIN